MDYQNIILAPIVTEKSTALKAQGTYSFRVAKKATKIDIANAVRKLWGVKVHSVRIVNTKSKIKAIRSAAAWGHSATYKKAYVRLADGGKIAELDT
jgi:large subunit ribosomal protein L23